MQRLQVIGNLGADATVKVLENQAKAINFTVAVTEKYNETEYTNWFNCTIWKTPAQEAKVADFLKKGTKVYVEGKPSSRAYSDNQGQLRSVMEIRVDRMELLGGKQAEQSQQPAPISNDDLPF